MNDILVLTMSRRSHQPLNPIPEEVTPADHEILCNGGTSSTLERLQSRLQRAKQSSPDIKKRLEEHAYEASYLKAELQWHKESKQIFLQFHEHITGIFSMMEDAIASSLARLHESERRYLSIWTSDGTEAPEGHI